MEPTLKKLRVVLTLTTTTDTSTVHGEFTELREGFESLKGQFDVAVATHKTIDLVVQTQVKKLQRNMQGYSSFAVLGLFQHDGCIEMRAEALVD